MKYLFVLPWVFLLGCTFSREIVNPQLRELDTSWIEPGKTTKAEVVKRIGLPPSVREVSGLGKNSFHWITSDTFTGRLELGYIVTPTFERGRIHDAEDLMVIFDDRDVVKLVSRTRDNGEKIEILEWKE